MDRWEQNSPPVLSGEFVLFMWDSKGLPLSVQCEIMRDNGWAFDVCGFIRACLDNQNYSLAKPRAILMDAGLTEAEVFASVGYVLAEADG